MCRTSLSRILFALLAIGFATGCASNNYRKARAPYDSTFTGRPSWSGLPPIVTTEDRTLIATFQDPAPGSGRDGPTWVLERKPYFIEFRARGAVTYGHALVAFGQLYRNGEVPIDHRGRLIPSMTEITGLHPANVAMAIGHAIPVPAKTTPTDGDHEDAYILKKYRIDLTRDEFVRTVAAIKRRKSRSYVWHGVTQSCVTYVRNIARDLGLEVAIGMQRPAAFVTSLEELNGPNPRLTFNKKRGKPSYGLQGY